jgi:thymidylate synthase/dihydrofolate reductase
MFNIIAACDDAGGIGRDGTIPWAGTEIMREDMREFRMHTIKGVVIMGTRTYESIGGPLGDRTNIVVSRNQEYLDSLRSGYTIVYTATSFEDALKVAQEQIAASAKSTIYSYKLNGKIWVIGGAELYAEALRHPKFHRAYISRIRGNFDCDVFMPKIDFPQLGGYNSGEIDVEIYGSEEEDNYLNLMRRLLTAPVRSNRTGISTRGLFAETLEFSLTRGVDCIIPLLTTKKVPVKVVIAELLWFLGGKCTDTRQLLEHNCHIWDGNTTREFLDSRGLSHYNEGECGPIYGYQWRSWNRPYTPLRDKNVRNYNTDCTDCTDCADCTDITDIKDCTDSTDPAVTTDTTGHTDSTDTTSHIDCAYTKPALGIDQLARVIGVLRTDPFDRRMIVSAWNPEQLSLMTLPPCHWSFQFHCEVNDNSQHPQKYTLNCLLNMRSADMALGVPFNIASYALLTHMVAKCVNMRPGRLVVVMADCHLYENHFGGVREQVQRTPGQFPTVSFSSDVITGGDIDQFKRIDQVIIGAYQPHGVIKYPMAV